jgi:hypothetical protein
LLNKILIKTLCDFVKKSAKGFFVFCFLFFVFSKNQSQNLVPNGNFEIYSTCPNAGSQITYATGWSNPESYTNPDYYNSCATYTTGQGVPNNSYGWQQDFANGNGYAGTWAFNKGFPNNGRDYIQIKLTDTLKKYHKYHASMFVSLCNYCDYAISSMGMYFTPNAVQGPTTVGFMNIPNPQVRGKLLLSDTLNWIAVQDTFLAQGGELYLTIGNFNYDSLSDTTYVGARGFGSASYYYIDSVSVFDTGLTGVNELKKQDVGFKISPNPNDGNFTIEYKILQDAEIEIRDMQGKLVFISSLPANNTSSPIACANLENGIYLLKISIGGVFLQTKKLIIAK